LPLRAGLTRRFFFRATLVYREATRFVLFSGPCSFPHWWVVSGSEPTFFLPVLSSAFLFFPAFLRAHFLGCPSSSSLRKALRLCVARRPLFTRGLSRSSKGFSRMSPPPAPFKSCPGHASLGGVTFGVFLDVSPPSSCSQCV